MNHNFIPKSVFSYWKDGKMICKGTVSEISEVTGFKHSTLYRWHKKGDKRIRYEGRLEFVYELYAPDGTVYFKGTKDECADKLFIARSSFIHAFNDMKRGRRTGKNGAELIRRAGVELRK